MRRVCVRVFGRFLLALQEAAVSHNRASLRVPVGTDIQCLGWRQSQWYEGLGWVFLSCCFLGEGC